MSGVLKSLYGLLEQIGGDVFDAFRSFGSRLIKAALDRFGWDHLPTDDHSDKLLRTTVIGLLDSFGGKDESILAEARRRFDEHWENPAALHSDFKSTVYKIVLKNGGVKEYERILRSFNETEDNSIRVIVLHTLGCTSDPALKRRTLDWAVKGNDVKLQDFFYPIGAVSNSLAGSDMTWAYFKENLELYKSKLAKASPSLMDAVIVNSVGVFCTIEHAQEIENYFDANPIPKSSRRISQLIESIRNSGVMLNKLKESELVNPSFWNA